MFVRNALLVLGVFCILGSMALGYVWLTTPNAPPVVIEAQPAPVMAPPPAVILTAAHPLASGALLQQEDIAWKEVSAADFRPGNIIRGQTPESEFLGAASRREYEAGEALLSSDLLKLNDPRFLAAALKPGNRAISISVDASQSASGLILPGNHVDVILVQNVADGAIEGRRRIVAETILQDVRVLAVDQTLNQAPRMPVPGASPLMLDGRIPKTVTLELAKRQAEMVFVALQLGALQLSVRPFENAGSTASASAAEAATPPTWASDVSPAFGQLTQKPSQPTSSSIEAAVRRPPSS
jgi:pilus assembly protein CpaB